MSMERMWDIASTISAIAGLLISEYVKIFL